MAHANRVEQLEGLRNISTNADFYERLAAGKFADAGSESSGVIHQYIPVPITLKAQLGSPVGLCPAREATSIAHQSLDGSRYWSVCHDVDDLVASSYGI